MNKYEELKKVFIDLGIKIVETENEESCFISFYKSNWWAPTVKCTFSFKKESKEFIDVDFKDM